MSAFGHPESIFHDLTRGWRHHPGNPAAVPVTPITPTTPTTGGHVKLAQLAADTADSISQARGWLDKTNTDHIAPLLAEVARYQASPIIQALEGVTLSPEAETAIATLVKAAATVDPQQHNTMANPEAEQPAPEHVA